MILSPITEAAGRLHTAMTSQPGAGRLHAASASIDRDTGREWVEHELSKPEYAANDLTPLEQIGRWLSDLWNSLIRTALGANSPWLLVFVVLGLAAIIALIVWRVRRAGFRRVGVPLSAFDPVVSQPEPGAWRESAARAARAGDFETAVIDQSRAIFAVLSLKQTVSLESSATASEIAHSAEAALPEHGPAVHGVAEVFNDLRYGEETAQTARTRRLDEVYADLCALDRTLSALPVRHHQSAGRQEAPA